VPLGYASAANLEEVRIAHVIGPMLDVVTEALIHRPRELVAAYAADPAKVTRWYSSIRSVEWLTPIGRTSPDSSKLLESEHRRDST
jgi:hypothetical protein